MSHTYPLDELKQQVAALQAQGFTPPHDLLQAIEGHEAKDIQAFDTALRLKRQQRQQG